MQHVVEHQGTFGVCAIYSGLVETLLVGGLLYLLALVVVVRAPKALRIPAVDSVSLAQAPLN